MLAYYYPLGGEVEGADAPGHNRQGMQTSQTNIL